MKKIISVVLLFSLVCVSIYAKKPQPLNPETITEPVPLTSITFFIQKDMDTDNKAKTFIPERFPEFIESILASVKEQTNIDIDSSEFIQAVSDGSIIIEFEDVDLGGSMKLNQYQWKSKDSGTLYSYFTLPFVILDDGSMPLSVTLVQEGAKKKDTRSLTIQVPLVPVAKEAE